MEKSVRQRRVASELKSDLAALFPSIIQWDDVLKNVRISVNEIRLSSDLKIATIFISFQGEKDSSVCLKHLKTLAPEFRKKLSQRSTSKFTPVLRFVFDEVQAHEKRMYDLFHAIAEDLKPDKKI